jgi:hypothetical protein
MPQYNLPAKRGRKKGSTLQATRERREEVLKSVLKGTQRDLIVCEIMQKYNVSEPSVSLDLQIVQAEIRKQYEAKLPDMVATNHAKLDRIFEQWDTVDGNLQVKIIDIQNKMAGVYKPETAVQVNNLSLNLDHLTVEELKQLLQGEDK